MGNLGVLVDRGEEVPPRDNDGRSAERKLGGKGPKRSFASELETPLGVDEAGVVAPAEVDGVVTISAGERSGILSSNGAVTGALTSRVLKGSTKPLGPSGVE